MTAGEMALVRIRREVETELEHIAALANELASIPAGNEPWLLRARGSVLHDFYNGVERISVRIATELGGMPQSPHWHRQLLEDMAIALDDVRPAVTTRRMVEKLRPYLRFRHVFRNGYGQELDATRLKELIASFDQTHEEFRGELQTFTGWMREQSSAASRDG